MVATASALNFAAVQSIVQTALDEDAAWRDLTTAALVGEGQVASARIVAREEGVLAGVEVARATFLLVDRELRFESMLHDGARLGRGDAIAVVAGKAGGLLRAERVALNFLQHMSGIATATSRYVCAVQGTKARIVDTRKTMPGLRALEKYAVTVGGGFNHRFGLADGVLIKDNHLAALRARGLSLQQGLELARQKAPHSLRIEVEVETLNEVDEALAGGADVILLDNMPVATMAEAVRRVGGRGIVEASGGITIDSVRAVAEAGVDIISVGALTHSVKALDIALDFMV